METWKLVVLGTGFAVVVALFIFGIFVRRTLRGQLRAALGDSYREERTYASVFFGAIALDEQGLRFAWTGGKDEDVLIIGVDEVVEVICEKGEKPILATIFKILTNRDDLEDLQFISFNQDRLRDIAARLNAMRNKAGAGGIAAPVPSAATAAETDTLITAIQQLTAAVTTLTGSMRGFTPSDGRRRPIRRNMRNSRVRR